MKRQRKLRVAGRGTDSKKLTAAGCHVIAKSYLHGEFAMSVLEAWYDAIDLNEVIANIKNKQNKAFTRRNRIWTDQSARKGICLLVAAGTFSHHRRTVIFTITMFATRKP
jgi:hypothetical protein